MNNRITYEPVYNGYEINVRPESGCYTSILDKIIERFQYALSKHSKILLIRIDVSYPSGYIPKDNLIFQGFFENYIRYLQRKGFDPVYLWCSEVGSRSKLLHHHIFFLMSANDIQWMPNLNKPKELWSRALGVYPVIPEGCVKRVMPTDPEDDEHQNKNHKILHRLLERKCIIHRGDTLALQEAVYWCAYLAKEFSKNLPSGVRMFGCSQLPRNNWNNMLF